MKREKFGCFSKKGSSYNKQRESKNSPANAEAVASARILFKSTANIQFIFE